MYQNHQQLTPTTNTTPLLQSGDVWDQSVVTHHRLLEQELYIKFGELDNDNKC